MLRPLTAGWLIVMASLTGCTADFDPRGPFEPALVVYSIMQSSSDSQFVRLHATYDPPGFDPLAITTEPDLSSAVVTVRSDSGTVVYRDTLVPHPDPSRYGSPLRVFYATPFLPVRGRTYELTAQVPGYPTASATSVLPGPVSSLRLDNAIVLGSPRLYGSSDMNVTFRAPSVGPPRGYLVRMFVEFEVLSQATVRTVEVPASLSGFGEGASPVYPDLVPVSGGADVSFTFGSEAYQFILLDILARYGVSNVAFRRAIIKLYMVDTDLYEYYNVANGFRDEFSIRTDRPDISNVSGGVGVFGSLSLDTLSLPLSSSIDL